MGILRIAYMWFINQNTLQVLYYGLIKQLTGEDWTNAKLSLSTANPSIGGSVPELGMQLLKFKRVYVARKSNAIRLSGSSQRNEHARKMNYE